MYSPAPLIDARRAAYARLASRVLEGLNDAVQRRVAEGISRSEIADRLGCHRSRLSRVLNGTVPNLTLRTISDILWATDYESRDFVADPLEELTANCPTHREHETEYVDLFAPRVSTVNVDFSEQLSRLWLQQQPAARVNVDYAAS